MEVEMSEEHFTTLFELCQNSLNEESEHIAVEHYWLDKELNVVHRSISYKELKRIVDKVSKVIAKSTEAYRIIGMHLEPSIELVIGMLSILKVNKVFAPLEMKPKSNGLSHLMSSTTMRYILSSQTNYMNILSCLKNCRCPVKVVAEIDCEVADEKLILVEITLEAYANSLTLSDLAYITRTSGTTGIPKIIAATNSCIVPNVLHLSSIFDVQSSAKVALMSPPTFDPSIVEIFLALYNCATLVIPSTSIKGQPLVLGDVLFDKGKVSVLQATPSIIQRFSTKFLRKFVFCDTSSLDVMAFGGEACPSYKTIQGWINHQNISRGKLPNKFFNVYGISEMSSWASCHTLHPDKILSCMPLPVSLGCPLLKTTLQIRDEDSNAVLCQIDGEENLSDMKSSNEITAEKCRCSLGNSEIKGKLYIGGKHRPCHIIGQEIVEYHFSGDIAEIIFGTSGDAPILKYLGRTDSTVKRNGMKIDLQYVARQVTDIADLKFCHMAAIESNRKVMTVIAFLVRDDNYIGDNDKVEIVSDMNSKMWTFNIFRKVLTLLNPSQMPDRFLEISCLPVNSHGKVNDILLKQLLYDHNIIRTCDIDVVYLKVVMTKILNSILSNYIPNVSGNEELQLHLDFDKNLTNLGGNSFAATVLVNWLEVFLDVDLSSIFPDIFEIVLRSSLNEIIEKLSTITLRSFDVAVSNSNRKHKLDLVETVKKSSRLSEVSFPFHISRGKNVRYSRHGCLQTPSSHSSAISDSRKTVKPVVSETWKCDTGKCIDASPLVYLPNENEEYIYIGSHSHRFICLDINGKIVWSVTFCDRIESSACICTTDKKEFVAVGCNDHKVYILNARTGEIHWTFKTGAEVKSSPCWSQDLKLLYCGSHDGHLYALNIKEKECRWKNYCHGGSIYSSPVLANVEKYQCLIFAATLQGRIICTCGQSGEEKWTYLVGKPIFSSPCVDESGIYFGCVDNLFYSLSLDGHLNWIFQTGSPIFSSPTFSCCENYVIIGSHDGYLYKISKLDGSLLWKTMMSSNKSPVFSTPFSIAGMVVSASTKGVLCFLDGNIGSILSQTELTGEVFSSPVAVLRCTNLDVNRSITVYIGCRDNNLHSMEVSGL